ncbi:carboxypeptidase regulatory-like domain-containing protein [Arthrobacter sp. V1I9]|uniref:carboxypeptidase regulatory-like domain-containing protein n=1 Tax=Arthrobacter sp. V1I9 TaxID=3042275 RepID=UPI0027D7C311|nr:carboxypeptidase regulatory-like domain-containing protein [Arthrobacter sp. V1I9]
MPANAADLSDASISGHISVPPGADARTTAIHVYAATPTGEYVTTAYPAAEGAYSVSNLSAGSYKLWFSDYTSKSVPQWYGGADQGSATGLTVGAGQQLTGIDVVMAKGASISGHITAPAGVDLSAVGVYAYNSGGYAGSRWAAVAEDGSYKFTALAAGSYKLQFTPNNSGALEQWYGGAVSSDSATAVLLTAEQELTGVDAVLVKGASISGKVTAPAGVDPASVSISVHKAAQYSYSGYAQINSDGSYAVRGLSAGSYKLEFNTNNSSAAKQWYSGAATFETATPVTVDSGQDLTGIDDALVKAASISGQVTAPAGVDLASVQVQLYQTDGSSSYAGSAQVQVDGTYTVGGLSAGSYKVHFSGYNSGALEQWYPGAASSDTATVINLTAGQGRGGVDATLVKGASISGHLTATAGVELSYITVTVRSGSGQDYGSGPIGADGAYLVRGLPAGSYKVQFSGSDSYSGALEQWHSGAASADTATPVTVAEGQDLAGVDATLVKGASISGTVTAPAGVDVNYLSVYAESLDGSSRSYGNAEFNGNYTLRGLAPGSYKVRFSGYNSGTLTQWYSGASTFESATPVILAEAQDLSGIDAALVMGASISGKVTAPPGTDLTSVYVNVSAADHSSSLSGRVNYDGSYLVRGLPAGAYKVQFSGSGAGLLDQWHANASSFETATPLTLAAGQDLTEIDATLVKGASISGTVTAPAGVDLSGVSVQVRSLEGSTGFNTQVNRSGKYTVRGLPAGTYKVQFSGFASGTLDQWYAEASTFESATAVTVTASQDLTGIDAELKNGASISGKISAPAGVDLKAVWVTAYHSSGAMDYAGSSSVAADGSYKVGGLQAGSYKLEINSGNSGALNQWYGGGLTFSTATAIVITDGQAAGNADAVLVKGVSLSGKVTAPAGVSVSEVTVSVLEADSGSQAGYAWVAVDGSYRVGGLRAGNYKVQFNGGTSGALDAWHGGGESLQTAATVAVGASEDLADLNVSLVKGATISGKITAPSGVDLTRVNVAASLDERPMRTWFPVNADGTYVLKGLPAGTYKVLFSGPESGALDEWYDDAKMQAEAAPIVLTAGQGRTGIDAVLALGASISGKVTVPAGVSSSGVVILHKSDNTFAKSVYFGSDGNYLLQGLDAGSYKLQFVPYTAAVLQQWYSNASSMEAAATVTLTDGQSLTSMDATLVKGATISGKITAPDGVSLGAAQVGAFKSGSADVAAARSSVLADGSYTLVGLEPGTYKLQFFGVRSGAVDSWFGGSTFEAATARPVTAEQNLTGVDVTVVTGASITGKVAGANPQGYPLSVLDETGKLVKSEYTDQSGNYSVVGLAAGSYKVAFNRSSGYSTEEAQYYQNKPESAGINQAQLIQLAAGQSVPNVDATLAKGGSIGGTVLDKAGKPAPYLYVQAYTVDGSLVTRGGMTDGAGKYNVTGLTSGKYVLRVHSWMDGELFSGNADTEAAASPVTVVGGNSTPHDLSWAAVRPALTAPNPTITGTVVVGSTLTAVPGIWEPAPVTLAYQWKADGTAITGATANTYKPTTRDAGKTLTVTVTGTKDGYTTVAKTSAATTAVAAGTLTAPDPTITGTAAVGSTLTAVPGTWEPAPITLAYQWKANGTAITGATANTYKPTTTDLGKTLTVTVTGTKDGYTTVVKTSPATGTVMAANPVLTAPMPTISGTAKVGVALTAVPGTWGPATVTLGYQWKANGIAITGATAAAYRPAATDLGKTLAVTVTGTKAGYTTVAKTSTATAKVAGGTLGVPAVTIKGTLRVGSTLTAAGTWGPAPVTLKYQWKANGIAITGATASTYRPAATVLGKILTVTVTGSKSGYTTAAKTSAATAKVAAGLLTAPVPGITGTAKVGNTLTAIAIWGPAPVTLKYQWKANGIAITGATASTYRPAATVLGKTLTVTVTGSKSGYTTVAKTSAATARVVAGTLTAPAPAITGTAKVGSRLAASPGTWGPAPVTLKYQWKANGIAITGATASTYTPTTTVRAKTVTVTVTGTKTGYTTVAKTSAATAKVI